VNAIRKDDNIISFPNGFPQLSANGDYDIIHRYDPEVRNINKIIGALDEVNTWVTQDFEKYGPPPNADKPINHAYNIYKTNKEDIIFLIKWLKDGGP